METFEREIPDQKIQKIKEILEKEHKREFSWEEATEAVESLKRFAGICVRFAQEECRKQELLMENPKGFHYDRKHGKCEICGEAAFGENSWYDRHGLKCMVCQNAINNKIIPVTAKDKKNWYSPYELEVLFNISKKELSKYLKNGFLKERLITTAKNKVHLQLFLLSDNKDVLPPKKLVDGKIIEVENKGEKMFTYAHWYEFVDEKSFDRLKKYKIVQCFPETFSKPIIDTDHLYHKSANPIFTLKK